MRMVRVAELRVSNAVVMVDCGDRAWRDPPTSNAVVPGQETIEFDRFGPRAHHPIGLKPPSSRRWLQANRVMCARTKPIKFDRLLTWSTTAFEVVILTRSSVTTIHHNNSIEGHATQGHARPFSQYRRLLA